MYPSLSIVLPVHNVQATLVDQVERLLDVLPELTPSFEVLIVDDGSTDQTDEVAVDLSLAFPQVRAVRHGRYKGIPAAVQTGLARTTGEIVFIQDQLSPLSMTDLRRLWELRSDRELVMARALPKTRPLEAGLLSRLMAWGVALKNSPSSTGDGLGGVQMIRREAIEEMRASERPEQGLALSRRSRTDIVSRTQQPQSAPNFLKRVRDFATGE